MVGGLEAAIQNSKDLFGWTDAKAAGRACLLALEVSWTGMEVMYIVGEEHCATGCDAETLLQECFPTAVLKKRLEPNEGCVLCLLGLN